MTYELHLQHSRKPAAVLDYGLCTSRQKTHAPLPHEEVAIFKVTSRQSWDRSDCMCLLKVNHILPSMPGKHLHIVMHPAPACKGSILDVHCSSLDAVLCSRSRLV